MAEWVVQNTDLSEDRSFENVVLLGRNSSDKCMIRNTLLTYEDIKPDQFTYEMSFQIGAKWITIIDPPDISNRPNPEIKAKISEYIDFSTVFLLVFQQGQVSAEDISVFSYFQQTFGQKLVDQMFPVLVVKEPSMSAAVNQNLKMIDHACGNRLCFFYREMDRMELIRYLTQHYNIPQMQGRPELKRHEDNKWSLPTELRPSEERQLEDSRLGTNQVVSKPDTKKSSRERNVMTIVLLGQTGSGKSATGNTILARRQFESRASSTATTQKCEKADGLVCGIKVRVIDTPDFFDPDLSYPEVHIQRCKELSKYMPVVYLLVMHMGRFTDGEREALSNMEKMFGAEVFKQTIILFTGKEKLKGRSLDDYIRNADLQLQQMLKKCGSRYIAFSNNEKRPQQVRKLMESIMKMQVKQGQDIKELYPDFKKTSNGDCTPS